MENIQPAWTGSPRIGRHRSCSSYRVASLLLLTRSLGLLLPRFVSESNAFLNLQCQLHGLRLLQGDILDQMAKRCYQSHPRPPNLQLLLATTWRMGESLCCHGRTLWSALVAGGLWCGILQWRDFHAFSLMICLPKNQQSTQLWDFSLARG